MGVTLRLSVLAMGVATLAACAGGDGRYPSLAKRPAEAAFDVETGDYTPPAPPPAPAPVPPVATPAEIAALLAAARTAHVRFAALERDVAGLMAAARGLSVENDTRARAMLALADLTARRGATSSALADLDLLAAEAATTFAPADAIEDARRQVAALVASEDAAIARLTAQMGP